MFIARERIPSGAVRRSGRYLGEYRFSSVPLLRTAQGFCYLRVYKHLTPTE